jgi:hypothetical protein
VNGSAEGLATSPPSGSSDSTKIVATGDSVLEVAKGNVPKTAAAVVAVAKGAGGYVSDNHTAGAPSPSAEVTIRVPYANFDDVVLAVQRLATTYNGKVVQSSTHSSNVTGQYTDLQARRDAAVHERDQLELVLQQAHTIGDILAVQDRITSVQTQIDQLTGQIKVLNDQATYSSLDVSISEKAPVVKPAAAPAKPLTGMALAWHEAGSGFSHSVEWIVARSGKAFVAIVAIIALLFLLRYLYPVIRRGLL